MSRKSRNNPAAKLRAHASVFAALGDETRLALVAKLSDGRPCNISELTRSQMSRGSGLTRQAITKHLGVLKRAGMVHTTRVGRARQFAFNPGPIAEMKEYLDFVSQQWDEALGRLKAFVEK